MPAANEDLDLLLSLGEEIVLETPPGSPSHIQGYASDEGPPRRLRSCDMSVFREAVKDYLDSEPTVPEVVRAQKKTQKKTGEIETERFSGLRVKNPLVSSVELSNRFSDVRFVRMSVIRNLLSGDTLCGSWATVGVLTEKREAKASSAGKQYCVWKMGCLDETDISVFLFGNAYKVNCNDRVGSVFALFNLNVRKDDAGKGFSLSLHSVGQILKIGTSADFGVCKGKRKDGMACTMVINRNKGSYCKFHSPKATQKYTTARAELKGGNLRMAFRPKTEGIYIIDPQAGLSNKQKSLQQVKVMSVNGLKKVLSSADTVTTNLHSQGIRFLSQVTAKNEPKVGKKHILKPNEAKISLGKRPAAASTNPPVNSPFLGANEAKRRREGQAPANMIELDIISSDEDV